MALASGFTAAAFRAIMAVWQACSVELSKVAMLKQLPPGADEAGLAGWWWRWKGKDAQVTCGKSVVIGLS